MADNLLVDDGADSTVATDEISSVHFQRVKLALGADGVNDGDVALANPVPTLDALAIARGVQSGWGARNQWGRNLDVDIAAQEDIWDGGAVWAAPTTARTHDIVSTSTSDTSAGTGAQTVTVEGLDSLGDAQSETVSMNGTTNVPTANTYTMIHRIYVATAGSGGQNAGVITATAQTDATVTARIETALNESRMAIYKVPNGKTAYVRKLRGEVLGAVAAKATFRLLALSTGADQAFRTLWEFGVRSDGDSSREITFEPHLPVAALTLLKLAAVTDTDNSDLLGSFDLAFTG